MKAPANGFTAVEANGFTAVEANGFTAVEANGFTLVESMIALALTLIVTVTAFALVAPASQVAVTLPEMTDVEQRARVAAESIARDLGRAGAGIDAGPRAGVLHLAFPPVLPRRVGLVNGDAPNVARGDALTMITVPVTASQTTIATEVSVGALTLNVNASPNCPAASALCGFSVGQDVVIADTAGHFDLFRITQAAGAAATLRYHGQSFIWTYPAGSTVSQVESRTYYFDAANAAMRQYDGDQTDQPAVDHIAALSFSYFGEISGGVGLVPLPLAIFTDGPWRGAGSTAFDEDLLRIRAIRVTVRARAADPTLRTRVPEFGITLDVAPRNLSVGR